MGVCNRSPSQEVSTDELFYKQLGESIVWSGLVRSGQVWHGVLCIVWDGVCCALFLVLCIVFCIVCSIYQMVRYLLYGAVFTVPGGILHDMSGTLYGMGWHGMVCVVWYCILYAMALYFLSYGFMFCMV